MHREEKGSIGISRNVLEPIFNIIGVCYYASLDVLCNLVEPIGVLKTSIKSDLTLKLHLIID
jgi:hypothetical protein